MRKTLLAILKNGEKVLGYCIEDSDGYRSFDDNTDLDTKGARIIDLAFAAKYEVDTTKSLDEIIEELPIGTPLKIKGDVEGMCGQQLVYVGHQRDSLGTVWYWFFDGRCATDEFPEAFGYALKQLNYNGVKVIWNNNNKKKVEELLDTYSLYWDIARYL